MSNSYGNSLGSSTNGTGYAPALQDTPRQTKGEVESSLSNVRDELCNTEELLKTLHSKLYPALAPCGPAEQSVGRCNPYATELAQAIQDGAVRIDNINRIILDIIERIQL